MATIQSYSAKNNQSLYDICLQTYGTLNLLYKLAMDNGITNINSTAFAGQIFTFDTSLVNDKKILEFNIANRIVYISSLTTSESELDFLGSFDDSFDDSFDN